MSKFLVTRMEYLVSQFIDVIDCETGQSIDCMSESEYYATYASACKRADELRSFIGETVCEWGDGAYGVLQDVYCDDEPRGIQYYE